MADAKLAPAMHVRAEAMRLAIECGKAFKDASFADLTALAEQIEAWLYEARSPAIVRVGAEALTGGSEFRGHA